MPQAMAAKSVYPSSARMGMQRRFGVSSAFHSPDDVDARMCRSSSGRQPGSPHSIEVLVPPRSVLRNSQTNQNLCCISAGLNRKIEWHVDCFDEGGPLLPREATLRGHTCLELEVSCRRSKSRA